MIIDFHTHYTPPEMMRLKDQGLTTKFVGGAPAHTHQPRLGDLNLRIETMDQAGVDLAVLSCPIGIDGSLEECKLINDKLGEAASKYPGRLIGLAHIPALGGDAALRELERAANEFGCKGVTLGSDVHGVPLDSKQLQPFYEKVQELGLYIFVHPSDRGVASEMLLDHDLARCVGRETALVAATIRLINGCIFDDFPGLKVQMSHLGGGIAPLLGRIRSYQRKEFWGTVGNERHGKLPKRPFDDYFGHMYFDTAGYSGNINSVKAALLEMKPSQLLFGDDYPAEVRSAEVTKAFVENIRKLDISPEDINGILAENGKKLLGL